MLFTSNELKITQFRIIQAKLSFNLLNMETGSQELVILSYATVCPHPSVSLNNEKKRHDISADKTTVSEKTAGPRSGNSSDLDSACLRVFVSVKIFQFEYIQNENRFLGHNIRPNTQINCIIWKYMQAVSKCLIKVDTYQEST